MVFRNPYSLSFFHSPGKTEIPDKAQPNVTPRGYLSGFVTRESPTKSERELVFSPCGIS